MGWGGQDGPLPPDSPCGSYSGAYSSSGKLYKSQYPPPPGGWKVPYATRGFLLQEMRPRASLWQPTIEFVYHVRMDREGSGRSDGGVRTHLEQLGGSGPPYYHGPQPRCNGTAHMVGNPYRQGLDQGGRESQGILAQSSPPTRRAVGNGGGGLGLLAPFI